MVKNIHYGDIHKRFEANFILDNEKVPFINKDVDLSNIRKDCYIKDGDLEIGRAHV